MAMGRIHERSEKLADFTQTANIEISKKTADYTNPLNHGSGRAK